MELSFVALFFWISLSLFWISLSFDFFFFLSFFLSFFLFCVCLFASEFFSAPLVCVETLEPIFLLIGSCVFFFFFSLFVFFHSSLVCVCLFWCFLLLPRLEDGDPICSSEPRPVWSEERLFWAEQETQWTGYMFSFRTRDLLCSILNYFA